MNLRPSKLETIVHCAICKDPAGDLVSCDGCATRIHEDCFGDKCPTLGCRGRVARPAPVVPPARFVELDGPLDSDQRDELTRRAWEGDEEAEAILLADFDRSNVVESDADGFVGVRHAT